MAPQGLAHGWRRTLGPTLEQGQHRTGDRLAVQGLEGTPGRGQSVDHHRGEGLPGRRLERRLPAGIDLDQVEQGPEDAVHTGEAFRTGTRPGLVEGEGQGVGPGQPGVVVRLGRPMGHLGTGQGLLGVGPPLLGAVQRLDQGQLGLLRRTDLGPQAIGLLQQTGRLLGEHVDPRPHPGHLAASRSTP